jgi:fructose/tagatose bisphosphate aldolase
MPLITSRNEVLKIYSEAAKNKWVIPSICTENTTTTESILAATLQLGSELGIENLPITIAVTNNYSHRAQTVNYSHTRNWEIGLKLFLSDLRILTEKGSPYSKLRVMIHLDHVQPDLDKDLLSWDMSQFSSIMFDASALIFEENIRLTAQFAKDHRSEIAIEGACDEINEAGNGYDPDSSLTTPEKAVDYLSRTGVDFMVANLGTEHRASASVLKYRDDLARSIKEKVGEIMVLHGCSSVASGQLADIFNDGIAKVNIWTILERNSSAILFENLVNHATEIAGKQAVERLIKEGILGNSTRNELNLNIQFYTTAYRQEVVYTEMKKIVYDYLKMWYTI